MDRREAITFIAAHARELLSVDGAKAIALAIGIPFGDLLKLEPGLVRRSGEGKGWVMLEDGRSLFHHRSGWVVPGPTDFVPCAELGATLAHHAGLYGDRGHARSSQHGTPGKEAQYIGQRAAVRLAHHFYGKSGHTDRYGDDPAVVALVADVPDIRTAGVRHPLRNANGKPVMGYDGQPITHGGDQILIEKVYKPQEVVTS